MMETLIDILKVYGRIVTIIPLLLIVTLFMGKRSIGEVPVFDFLIIIVLGAVVGADIADPDIPHLYTFLSVTAIGGLQYLVSKLKLKNRLFGKLVTFEPTIVVREGSFVVGNMKKIRYSIDNILSMLRERDVFDVSEVELALVEANGKLTVFKKPNKKTVTIEDMGIKKLSGGIAYPIIIEGHIHDEVLIQMDLSHDWLIKELKKKGVKPEDVFYASVNRNHEIHFSLTNSKTLSPPEIMH